MTLGILVVLIWFAAVAALLVWQFATGALAAPEPDVEAASPPAQQPVQAPGAMLVTPALRPLPVPAR